MSEAGAIESLRAGEPIAILARRFGVRASRFQARCDELQLFRGVREGLQALAARGTRMAAVTNLPGRFVLPMLEGLGVRTYLPIVIHAGNCRPLKPHPRPLLNALAKLSVPADNAVFYVGDMLSDAEAAARAGVSFAWASYGYSKACPSTTAVTLRRFQDALDL
jgi:phosphoglycolate phosphatase